MPKYAPSKTYTCLMHPEVRQENPGNCPKCGLALELRNPLESKSFEMHTEYVCPMHPEIIRSKPGSCPKCGMALSRSSHHFSPTSGQYQFFQLLKFVNYCSVGQTL
jgi:ssDNA-binding Zn-finger/Zn-ribbon topoisomerase 1